MKRKKKLTPEQTYQMIGERLEDALRVNSLETLREAGFTEANLFDARRLAGKLQRGTLGIGGAALAKRLLPKLEKLPMVEG